MSLTTERFEHGYNFNWVANESAVKDFARANRGTSAPKTEYRSALR